jgi:hypothetical protein
MKVSSKERDLPRSRKPRLALEIVDGHLSLLLREQPDEQARKYMVSLLEDISNNPPVRPQDINRVQQRIFGTFKKKLPDLSKLFYCITKIQVS